MKLFSSHRSPNCGEPIGRNSCLGGTVDGMSPDSIALAVVRQTGKRLELIMSRSDSGIKWHAQGTLRLDRTRARSGKVLGQATRPIDNRPQVKQPAPPKCEKYRLTQQVFELYPGAGLVVPVLHDHRRINRNAPIAARPDGHGARTGHDDGSFGDHQRLVVKSPDRSSPAPDRRPEWSG